MFMPVQAGSAVLLVLVSAVAELAEAMNEDGPRPAVACFALVECAFRWNVITDSGGT
jgi:hypothetical protein